MAIKVFMSLLMLAILSCADKPFTEKAAAIPKSAILTPQTVALGIIDGVEENGSFSGTVLFSLSSEKNIKSVEILTPGLIAKNDGHKWLIDVAGHFKSHGRVVPVECQQPDSVEQVCVCTKAIADDGSFLIQSRCFARAKPSMKFAISGNKNFELLNDAVLDTRVLKNFSFSLQGKSGFTLKNCSLLLERIDGVRPRIISSDPRTNGDSCSIVSNFMIEDLEDGYYTLSAEVVDVAGQSSQQSIKIFIATKPADFDLSISGATYVRSSSVLVTGKGVKFPERVSKVIATVWPKDEPERTKAFAFEKLPENWSATIDGLDQDGIYILELSVTDDGGLRTLPLRELIVDRSAPLIFGHADGVIQPSYQDVNPKYQSDRLISIGTVPDWKAEPTLYRWAHQLYSHSGAPRYVFRIEDLSPVSIKVGVAPSCDNVPVLIDLPLASGQTEIVFTPKNLGFDFAQERGDRTLNLCIVAADIGGNERKQSIPFKWHTLAPPIEFSHIWVGEDRGSDDSEDFCYNGASDLRLFEVSWHMAAAGYVIASGIVDNPHEMSLRVIPDIAGRPAIKTGLKKYFYSRDGAMTGGAGEDRYFSFHKNTLTVRAFKLLDGGKSEELYSRDGSFELAPGGRLWIKWYFLPPRDTLETLDDGSLPVGCGLPDQRRRDFPVIGGEMLINKTALPGLRCATRNGNIEFFSIIDLHIALVDVPGPLNSSSINSLQPFAPSTNFVFKTEVGGISSSSEYKKLGYSRSRTL